MSIKDLRIEYFNKVDSLDFDLILEAVLKKPRAFILAHPEYEIPKFKIKNLKLKISRRIKHEPLAYILGHKEFYSLDFIVTRDTLVPRPETELMTEEALDRITHNAQRVTHVIDIGTGSGCIIITLAKILNKEPKTKNQKFFGIDISQKALTVARKNAKSHGVENKISFLRGNLLEPVLKKLKIENLKLKIILTANLPYLSPDQYNETAPELKYEPKSALVAGENGMQYYIELFGQIREWIKKSNTEVILLCEIDHRQVKIFRATAKNELPPHTFKIRKDARCLDRLVGIEIK